MQPGFLRTFGSNLEGNEIPQKILAEREGFEPSIQVLARITV